MKERKYLAVDRYSCQEIIYYSAHRANSAANRADLTREIRRSYSSSAALDLIKRLNDFDIQRSYMD